MTAYLTARHIIYVLFLTVFPLFMMLAPSPANAATFSRSCTGAGDSITQQQTQTFPTDSFLYSSIQEGSIITVSIRRTANPGSQNGAGIRASFAATGSLPRIVTTPGLASFTKPVNQNNTPVTRTFTATTTGSLRVNATQLGSNPASLPLKPAPLQTVEQTPRAQNLPVLPKRLPTPLVTLAGRILS